MSLPFFYSPFTGKVSPAAGGSEETAAEDAEISHRGFIWFLADLAPIED